MTRRDRRAQWLAHHRDRQSVGASVAVEIDQLVLHGIDPRYRYRIADAAGEQLAERFGAEPPDFQRSRSLDEVHTAGFEVATSNLSNIGAQVGEAIHGAVTGAEKP
jgi:hypothetical protein